MRVPDPALPAQQAPEEAIAVGPAAECGEEDKRQTEGIDEEQEHATSYIAGCGCQGQDHA